MSLMCLPADAFENKDLDNIHVIEVLGRWKQETCRQRRAHGARKSRRRKRNSVHVLRHMPDVSGNAKLFMVTAQTQNLVSSVTSACGLQDNLCEDLCSSLWHLAFTHVFCMGSYLLHPWALLHVVFCFLQVPGGYNTVKALGAQTRLEECCALRLREGCRSRYMWKLL
eukprot:2106419-Amphidinium_carterae.2